MHTLSPVSDAQHVINQFMLMGVAVTVTLCHDSNICESVQLFFLCSSGRQDSQTQGQESGQRLRKKTFKAVLQAADNAVAEHYSGPSQVSLKSCPVVIHEKRHKLLEGKQLHMYNHWKHTSCCCAPLCNQLQPTSIDPELTITYLVLGCPQAAEASVKPRTQKLWQSNKHREARSSVAMAKRLAAAHAVLTSVQAESL